MHNGIMFARWPFYPLTIIPPISSKLRERGVQPIVDEETKKDTRPTSYFAKNLTDSSQFILHCFHVSEKISFVE